MKYRPKPKECKTVLDVLRAIRDYKPTEITYDEFAYKRMVESYRTAARKGIAIAIAAGKEGKP